MLIDTGSGTGTDADTDTDADIDIHVDIDVGVEGTLHCVWTDLFHWARGSIIHEGARERGGFGDLQRMHRVEVATPRTIS